MTNTNSDAVSPGIITLIEYKNNTHTERRFYVCNRCGSLVSKEHDKEHKEMHRFMVDVVKALENHKNKISQLF